MRALFTRLFGAGAAALIFGLALCAAPGGPAAAAQDIWKPKRETPRPTPAPTTTGRRQPRPPRRERAQPATRLTVQGQFRKFTDDGLRKLVGSGDTFTPQDKLQFSVKVNQNGYLYVIRQTSAGGDGQLLFPSRFYNGGKSYAKEDQEFILPSNCSDLAAPCWFRMSGSAAEERLTVIFSRDRVESLPAEAPASGGPPAVSAQVLSKLLAGSEQQIRRIDGVRVPGVQDDRYTFWLTNTNDKNNEEIIYTLTLKGDGAAKAASGPAANN